MADHSQTEGVIKYQLNFVTAPAPSWNDVKSLVAWRTILFRCGLIGQDPQRYDGYGFGNLSRRLSPSNSPSTSVSFLMTGTQTGHLDVVSEQHFCTVVRCRPLENELDAEGPVAPSSEAMTHAMIYQLDPSAQCVIHVHSPRIWKLSANLCLPTTRPDIAYGTPEMAKEVERLFNEGPLSSIKIFSMGGHQDGIVCYGFNVDEAGRNLLSLYAKALEISRFDDPQI